MANKDLMRKPHHFKTNPNWWWYEEPQGICIVHEIILTGDRAKTSMVTIPWKSIRAALARKDLDRSED